MSHDGPAARRVSRASAQWLTMLTAVVVAIAMVAGAELARENADRHRRVQALVEHLGAQTQLMSALRWQAAAEQRSHSDTRVGIGGVIGGGFDLYGDIVATMRELRSIDGSRETNALRRDVNAMYASGMRTYVALKVGGLAAGRRQEIHSFRPAITRVGGSLARASAHQREVADRSSARSRDALLGSLVIGLLLIVLLGLRFERLRRRSHALAVERRGEKRVRALVENSSDAFVVLGPDLRVRWHAASLQRMLGQELPLLGEPLTAIAHPDDAAQLDKLVQSARGERARVAHDIRVRDANGGWRHVEAVVQDRLADAAIAGIVVNMRDITERRQLEDQLRHRAFHDDLTGLANRALFENRIAHASAVARRRDRELAVLFLDLDDFKTINDSLGHAAGDELLRLVAERVAAVLRAGDTASRQGGDEFAVLLEDLEGIAEAETIARRILDSLTAPFALQDRELTIGASIGLALSDGGASVEELLRNADIAMYAAKDDGKGAVRLFEPDMVRRFVDRLELRAQLGAAIERCELELDYQPIVELDSGRIVSAEALVRWRHPERGRLGPDQFIGLAEESGQIVALGHWVLRTACAQARHLHDAFPDRPPLAMSVNVSTRQLREPGFPDTVAAVLRETGLPAESLILELTESLLVDSRDTIMETLDRLKALGLRLAVDDFGTGYSVLSYLQEFPVDLLKIDKSFVDDIHTRPDKAKLVAGIVNLSDSLDLDVVAEGIEEAEQADELRAMRSPFGQGYLFSRPVAGTAVEQLLAAEPAHI